MKKRASRKILGKKVKNSCISKFFGPNSKTCIVKVRAAWGRVSRGLTLCSFLVRMLKFVQTKLIILKTWDQPLVSPFHVEKTCFCWNFPTKTSKQNSNESIQNCPQHLLIISTIFFFSTADGAKTRPNPHFVWMLPYTETVILYCFCTWKHKAITIKSKILWQNCRDFHYYCQR